VRERIAEIVPDRDTPLLLHCEVGRRSGIATQWLVELGYRDVVNLRGPIVGWADAGGAWDAPSEDGDLSEDQRRRYARHLLVPEIGSGGQRALLDARVLIVGAGGLGSPVALYLAAAGIGTIGLVDDDVVEESNLQRQVLHATDRIGQRKVDSAEATLRALTPGLAVVARDERLDADNAERLMAGYDVVVDGSDSLPTRYAINDAAVRLGLPVVHGSVHRWDGQVTTFAPGGPCYRCLHPVPPPPELAPDCTVAGVVGVVPGIVGMLQATEVIRLVVGAGEPLAGRLLVVDALAATFDEIRVARDPSCPTCGSGAATR
jgi:sulfur-carrier protein adenylyltransferase/sulfurtransferase